MKARTILVAGMLLGIACPPMAAAETDLLTAKKLSCIPDRFTRCSAPDKCESKEATANDKTQPMIINAETKSVVVRRKDQERAFGTIVDDKVAGDVRTMTLREPGDAAKPASLTLTITRAGKMTLASTDARMRAEATCSPAT